MVLEDLHAKYIPKDNDFYRKHSHHVLYAVMLIILVLIAAVGLLLYQILNRPLPQFNAMQPDGRRMLLIPYDEPNLLPDTILQWASKGATIAYTFDFVNYNDQIKAARPYFTENGWQDYLASVQNLIENLIARKLVVNGIVAGAPVISNQGPLPGRGYVWRIQIPFLVTYQSSNALSKRKFVVVISVVRVPTSVNPQGIGIDQFVMSAA